MEKPILFDLTQPGAPEALMQCRQEHSSCTVIDQYAEELKELCAIRNPSIARTPQFEAVWQSFLEEHTRKTQLKHCGVWAFFAWSNTLVHYLSPDMHHELRTARNRNLITAEEQKKFAEGVVGVVGLSVGSHAALTLAMSGGSHTMKIADPDTIGGSNLNRLRYGFTALGVPKTDVVARMVYEMNPFADLEVYDNGLNEQNIHDFIWHGKRLHVIIEEADDLGLKIQIRKAAQREKIPVVMVTDNGDGVIADVERYDLDPHLPLFAGRLHTMPEGDHRTWSPDVRRRVIDEIVDFSIVEPRMQASFEAVGKTLYSWPQLGTSATLAGVVATYLARQIIVGESCPTKRSLISLKKLL